MSSEKSLGIVIRVVDFSETSCVVTLFTRDFGKITGLAKGARRPKSAFESALDLLAVCRVVFLHKSSEALDLLTEAKLERRFRAAGRDLPRLYAGYYIAELLRELTQEGDPYEALYEAADRALLELDRGAEPLRVILRFELVTLRRLGHFPALEGCAACGQPLELDGTLLVGQLAGGLLCPGCRSGQRRVVRVTAPTVETLRLFAADSEAWLAFPVDAKTWGEIRGLIGNYICNLMEHRPRMHQYFGLLAGSGRK